MGHDGCTYSLKRRNDKSWLLGIAARFFIRVPSRQRGKTLADGFEVLAAFEEGPQAFPAMELVAAHDVVRIILESLEEKKNPDADLEMRLYDDLRRRVEQALAFHNMHPVPDSVM